MRHAHLLPWITLALAGCGPVDRPAASLAEPFLGEMLPPEVALEISRSFARSAAGVEAGRALRTQLVTEGLVFDRPDPVPQVAGRLERWTRKGFKLGDLLGRPVLLFEADSAGVMRLFLVRFDGDRFAKEAVLSTESWVWEPIHDPNQVARLEGLAHPPLFFSPDVGGPLELDTCVATLEPLRFTCKATPGGPASGYVAETVTADEAAAPTLLCLDRCLDPWGDDERPYLALEEHTLRLSPDLRAIRYDVDPAGPTLLHAGRPVLRADLPEWDASSGFMFEDTPDNVAAMSCDLDGDGRAAESCPWRPLDVFYTWSTQVDRGALGR